MSREDEAEMIMYVPQHFSDQSNMKRTAAFSTIYYTNIYDTTTNDVNINITFTITTITTTTTTTTAIPSHG